MQASSTPDTEVLIVGAGPTGLALALWLTRLGVQVRVIDKTAEPSTTSRALAVQARTLEYYDQIDLAGEVVAGGRHIAAANLWVAGRQVARAVFGDMGVDISPDPYPLVFPQDEHERLLNQPPRQGRRPRRASNRAAAFRGHERRRPRAPEAVRSSARNV